VLRHYLSWRTYAADLDIGAREVVLVSRGDEYNAGKSIRSTEEILMRSVALLVMIAICIGGCRDTRIVDPPAPHSASQTGEPVQPTLSEQKLCSDQAGPAINAWLSEVVKAF
jgi:hypothetical protein